MLGAGFATVRDLVPFLRHETADRNGTQNPLIAEGACGSETGIRHALAFASRRAGAFCAISSSSASTTTGTGGGYSTA